MAQICIFNMFLKKCLAYKQFVIFATLHVYVWSEALYYVDKEMLTLLFPV